MKLIDKDALVAEIERLEAFYHASEDLGARLIIEGLFRFINATEVKEVDFEKELDRIWFDNKLGNYFDNDALDFAHVRTMCKHFFELGMTVKNKAQKGE